MIRNKNKALELHCEGTKVHLYYFDHFDDDKSGPWLITDDDEFENGPSQWAEVNLSNPKSIDCIMEWLNKID